MIICFKTLAKRAPLRITKLATQTPLKIRSMACLMDSAKFTERPLNNKVKCGRWVNGYVIQANNQGTH